MEYADERIAMLEREYRRQEKEEALEAAAATQPREAEPEMTLGEMLEAVRTGEVFVGTEHFEFETRAYFEEAVPMVLVRHIYTGVKEEGNMAVFVSHDRDISQILTVPDEKMEEESIGKWKKRLETGMKMAGAYAEVTKEMVLENLDYLVYRTPTGKGWVYSLMFRIHTGSGKAVGNYNCMEKDKKTYGLMLEALVQRMNELLSGPDGEIGQEAVGG